MYISVASDVSVVVQFRVLTLGRDGPATSIFDAIPFAKAHAAALCAPLSRLVHARLMDCPALHMGTVASSLEE